MCLVIKNGGALGRFNSHIREAFSNNDHCVALNNAIRQYGADNMELKILKNNIQNEELYIYEDYYILSMNTLVPNGYNIKLGDYNIKSSDSKVPYNNPNYPALIKTTPDHTSKNVKKQIIVSRYHKEDLALPPFITCQRSKDGKITGYKVSFQNPTGGIKYIKDFTLTGNTGVTLDTLLNDAKLYLNQRKEECSFDNNKYGFAVKNYSVNKEPT